MIEKISLVYSSQHLHHQPRQNDGCENADRVEAIMTAIATPDYFPVFKPRISHVSSLRQLHSPEMVDALKKASDDRENFPQRTTFCLDQVDSTPIFSGTYYDALSSACCALASADFIKTGRSVLSYSISRPPGHHAGYDFYGGFCFFNNAMLAAYSLERHKSSRVAVLDFDHHHGNGSESIVNRFGKIIYVSTHADPHDLYPNTGYQNDHGLGLGKNHQYNFTYEPGVSEKRYLANFKKAIDQIAEINPDTLVISAGFDTHRGDHPPNFDSPTQISSSTFEDMAFMIGKNFPIPASVILEGGYGTHLPESFEAFFRTLNKYVKRN